MNRSGRCGVRSCEATVYASPARRSQPMRSSSFEHRAMVGCDQPARQCRPDPHGEAIAASTGSASPPRFGPTMAL